MLPPPYHQLVSDYKKADSNNISKAPGLVNWERLFNQKYIEGHILAFNDTILNTFRNFVPNKHITIDDKDPVAMTETINSKMKAKHMLYKKYIQNGKFESDLIFLENLITEFNELTFFTKTSYYKNLGKI